MAFIAAAGARGWSADAYDTLGNADSSTRKVLLMISSFCKDRTKRRSLILIDPLCFKRFEGDLKGELSLKVPPFLFPFFFKRFDGGSRGRLSLKVSPLSYYFYFKGFEGDLKGELSLKVSPLPFFSKNTDTKLSVVMLIYMV